MAHAHQNPLRVQRTDALPFHFPEGMDWDRLMARLDELDHQAAIVGPHGTGKTTLLDQLGKRLRQQGTRTRPIFINRERGKVSKTQWRVGLTDLQPGDVVLFDGADLLNMWTWWQLLRIIRQCEAGLVVTTHRESLLPTLIETGSSPQLFRALLSELLTESQCRRIDEPLDQVLARHDGNVRDALRELYDLFAAE